MVDYTFFILCSTFPMCWFWITLTEVNTFFSTVKFKRIDNAYRLSKMNGASKVEVEASTFWKQNFT